MAFPASSPLVTAVGGTSLYTDADGNYLNETVWNSSGTYLLTGLLADARRRSMRHALVARASLALIGGALLWMRRR